MNFIGNLITWKIIRLRTELIIAKNDKALNIDYQVLKNPEVQNQVEKASNAISNSNVGFDGIYHYAQELKNIKDGVYNKMFIAQSQYYK